ncbi:MAG: transglutaminase [Rhizobiaceae bacterium]|nr:transglutaminase [Rhizobiaceae bacterium]MCV0409003.1 transglutaminase [Rhizobiaceae bacterium]
MSDDALKATRFIDADHPAIRDFAASNAGDGDDVSKAVKLYYALRDRIAYDMRTFGLDEEQFVASNVLDAPSAFCVPKAIALAAAARAAGIPAKVGFANVRNHLTSPKLAALMDDDLFRWHAYTALFLDGKWVKATPAFDIALCERHGVMPLEFDGREDSIFHPFDKEGRRHMEYVEFIGEFDDMPYDAFAAEMRAAYPRMLKVLEEDRAKAAQASH